MHSVPRISVPRVPDGVMVTMIVPLCLFAAANLAYVILASAAESIGWLRVRWVIQSTWAVGLAVTTILAWQLDAEPRVYLYGYAVVQIAIHFLQLILFYRRGLVSLGRVFRDELAVGALALVVFAVSLVVTNSTEGVPLLLRLGAAALVTVATAGALVLLLPYSSAGRALAGRGLLPEKIWGLRVARPASTR